MRSLKRAFITELQINLQILNKTEELLSTEGKLTTYIPRLHTHMYEEIVRNGLLYNLSPKTINKIIETYEDIKRFNTISYISEAIVIQPNNKLTTINLRQIMRPLKTKIQQLLQELKTWQDP